MNFGDWAIIGISAVVDAFWVAVALASFGVVAAIACGAL